MFLIPTILTFHNSIIPAEIRLSSAALRSDLVKFPIPFHKMLDPGFNRYIGPKIHFPFQIIHVGTGGWHIPFLHGEKVLSVMGDVGRFVRLFTFLSQAGIIGT